MRAIKEYECDSPMEPSYDEIKKCVQIANIEDCIIQLAYFAPDAGWTKLTVKKGMTIEDCKDRLERHGLFIDRLGES